ncbi:hypothetical protein [Flavobacterium sp.]|uniref:hypothetical protein n=1 Tax=Flavobacterium sp. TaxID=239 RepID=UPI003A937E8F
MKRFLIPSLLLVGAVALLSYKGIADAYTKDEIKLYAKSIGIPQEDLYFIKNDLQAQYLEKGQPNLIVLNRQMQRLKAGTCYMEYPYYMDGFFEMKSQVKDTLSMYDMKFDGDVNKVFETIQGGETLKLDASKKYYAFYYFARYAKSKDKLIKKSMKRYKDSIQYFYVNVDNIKQ